MCPNACSGRMRLAVMVVASLARICHGAVWAAVVAFALAPRDATALFQLLLLQGGLVSLFSASSYARATNVAARTSDLGEIARSFSRFVALASGIAIVVAIAALPSYGFSSHERLLAIALFVVGAACAAAGALLQGMIMGSTGNAIHAFSPVVAVSFVASGISVASAGSSDVMWFATLWVIPQVATPVVLIAGSKSLRVAVFGRQDSMGAGQHHFAATGLVNATSVGIAFQFRERWASFRTGSEVEQSFLIVRFSDLAYQVAYMAAASVPWRLRNVTDILLASRPRRAASLVVVSLATLVTFTPIVLWDEWSLWAFCVAEVLAVPARLLAMTFALALLARESARAYVVALAGSMAAGLGLMLIPAIQQSPYSLQAFLSVGAVVTVVVASVTHAHSAASDSTAAPALDQQAT